MKRMRDPAMLVNLALLLLNSVFSAMNQRIARRNREFFTAYLKEKYGKDVEEIL